MKIPNQNLNSKLNYVGFESNEIKLLTRQLQTNV